MALPVLKEMRLSERRRLTGLLPGRLTIEGVKTNIQCRPVDVSTHGLGILIQLELKPGARARLDCIVKGEPISVLLEVAWTKPDFGKQDYLRVGLTTLDQKVDLEALFIQAGCMK